MRARLGEGRNGEREARAGGERDRLEMHGYDDPLGRTPLSADATALGVGGDAFVTRLLRICDAGPAGAGTKKGGGTKSHRPFSNCSVSAIRRRARCRRSLPSSRGLRTRRRGRAASASPSSLPTPIAGGRTPSRDALLAFGRLRDVAARTHAGARDGRALGALGTLGARPGRSARSGRSLRRRRWRSGRSARCGRSPRGSPSWRLRSRRGAGRCSSPSSPSLASIVGAGRFPRRRRDRPRRAGGAGSAPRSASGHPRARGNNDRRTGGNIRSARGRRQAACRAPAPCIFRAAGRHCRAGDCPGDCHPDGRKYPGDAVHRDRDGGRLDDC